MSFNRGDHTFIIGEIGINANGDIDIAKKIIDIAVECGCDAVKFQKRDPAICVPEAQKSKMRETPWGYISYLDYKYIVEFQKEEYDEIDRYCKQKGIEWFASAWDMNSVNFLKQYDCKFNKIASATLTDIDVLEGISKEKKYTYISTGMSTLRQIGDAVGIFRANNCPFELMHCNSEYPMQVKDANLLVMQTLRNEFGCNVGYSGHESGIIATCAAVAMGASSIERHITLSRSMYGSDQSASLEKAGLERLVRYVRSIESSFGSPIKSVTEKEIEMSKKLRNKQ
ncbi:MAG: N-acetylneuraminate synthase family protein [Synergistaceae bacterium]